MTSLRGKTTSVKRTRFGAGILRSLPTHRLPCTLADDAWWAEEASREQDRQIDHRYDAYLAQGRLDAGLPPW